MPQSIAISTTSAATSAYGGGAPSAVSLQAQLQRYQKQLSECVNCASAKTPQGKSDIQAISARISQIEQRMVQAANASSAPLDAGLSAAKPATSASATLGSLIDVFA
jgi:outer membrane murein-binding lipoprotein Lpp